LRFAATKKPPPKTRSSTGGVNTDDDEDEDDVEIQVELSDVNEALLDPIAHERVKNYRRIVRLNSAHVGKLNELVAKVRVRSIPTQDQTGGGLHGYDVLNCLLCLEYNL